jgi:hypothetical protein
MEVLYARCGGIDVHERFVVVCLSQVERAIAPKNCNALGR